MDTLIILTAKYLIFISALAALIYFLRQPRKRQKEMAVFAIVSLPIIYIAAKIGSWLYYDPRPFVVGHFTPLFPHDADNGFPSDHTLLAGAIAAVVWVYDRAVGWALFALALLIGISRVLAGVHHAVDIAGSLAFACAFAYAVYAYLMPAIKKLKTYKKYFA